ncbi:NAD-binding protein [Cytobacillus oceanisediminis]|uniref:NAD-binding protein n=1 Tax=Cytobacillus oceanisediminis TaxID=665099 RepID=UPI0037350AC5
MTDKNRNTRIVIIGWNERAKKLTEILASISPVKIYIIDNSLHELPFTTEEVVHIKGNSMHDSVLQEAGIKQTGIVFITADMHSTEHDSDARSIISLLAIKTLNPSAFTVVEILSESNINKAKRAGAGEVIYTSKIFARSVISSISEKLA